MKRCHWLLLALLPALACTAGGSRAAITIANHKDGDVLRYPVALVRGTADKGAILSIRNRDNARIEGMNAAPIDQNQFKALVELVPGVNHITLSADKDVREIALTYTPPTTAYRVNIIYLTAEDGDTRYITPNANDRQDYIGKMDTLAKLMQTFTAERMNDGAYGRMTFALDLDRNGRVKVNVLRFPEKAEELRKKDGNALYDAIYPFIIERFPEDRNKNVVVMAFTGYDAATKTPLAHTALGGGAMGLFSSNAMGSWPDSIRDVNRAFSDPTPVDDAKVWDDSAYRGRMWAMAATTIGATLHELGHTFGLPHVDDPESIMSRGFDHFNRAFTVVEPPENRRPFWYHFPADRVAYWDKPSADTLAASPWFRPDAPAPETTPAPAP